MHRRTFLLAAASTLLVPVAASFGLASEPRRLILIAGERIGDTDHWTVTKTSSDGSQEVLQAVSTDQMIRERALFLADLRAQ